MTTTQSQSAVMGALSGGIDVAVERPGQRFQGGKVKMGAAVRDKYEAVLLSLCI